jgi:hypothetical protein
MGQIRRELSMCCGPITNLLARLWWRDLAVRWCPIYWPTREWSPVAGRHTLQRCSLASPKNCAL